MLLFRWQLSFWASLIHSHPPTHGATAPTVPGPLHYRGFAITLRLTTLGMTPLDE